MFPFSLEMVKIKENNQCKVLGVKNKDRALSTSTHFLVKLKGKLEFFCGFTLSQPL